MFLSVPLHESSTNRTQSLTLAGILFEAVQRVPVGARAVSAREQERKERRPAVVRGRVLEHVAVWDAKLLFSERSVRVVWLVRVRTSQHKQRTTQHESTYERDAVWEREVGVVGARDAAHDPPLERVVVLQSVLLSVACVPPGSHVSTRHHQDTLSPHCRLRAGGTLPSLGSATTSRK